MEVVRKWFDAVAGGDVGAALRFAHEDVEWVNPAYAMEAGTRRGLGGLRTAFTALRDSFDELSFNISEVVDLKERVLVTGTFSGVGRASAAAFGPQTFGSVVTLSDGKVKRYEWFLSADEAREAAGGG